MEKAIFLAAVAVFATGGAGAAEWFAEVETTAGDFTIALDWEGAPKGCGAFAALAEGLADWVNPQSGHVEKGVEYFPGTSLSWVQHDATGEEKLLLGNRGRLFDGPDGEPNVANGSGLTLEDDLRDGGGRGLPARSVAMMNAGGPDTLDGQWAVFLADGDAYYGGRWSRIGTVVSNWSVVEAIAGGERDAETGMLAEPAAVTEVRVWSEPPEAMEAWRAGATNWPVCGPGDAGLEVKGEEGTLRCGWSPKSQYAVVHCGDLTAESRKVVWMNWNEGEDEAWEELPFHASEEGSVPFGKRHFCTVDEVEYPGLTGPEMRGNGWGLLTEWQWGDGTREQYLHELDWNAGTGTVWQATSGGGWTNHATVAGMGFWRAGAHSGELAMAEQFKEGMFTYTYYYYYRLGAPGADGTGRFRMTVFTGFGGTAEVWGDYGWMQTGTRSKATVARNGKESLPAAAMPDSDGVPTGEWRGEAAPPERGAWGGACGRRSGHGQDSHGGKSAPPDGNGARKAAR